MIFRLALTDWPNRTFADRLRAAFSPAPVDQRPAIAHETCCLCGVSGAEVFAGTCTDCADRVW